MITLIEALNYRCLRFVSQPLGPFHVLVGPNASGKTTFLDVVALIGRLVADGLEAAVGERTENLEDLLWKRRGDSFELAIEVRIPDDRRAALGNPEFDCVRYEISLGLDRATQEPAILAEKALLKLGTDHEPRQPALFPLPASAPSTILSGATKLGAQTIINKMSGGNDNFYPEVHREGKQPWSHAFRLGPRKSALGNLPEDESKFPVATWLKGFLADGVQSFVLNSQLIRRASPPGRIRGFRPDGSNLPWVVEALRSQSEERFRGWIEHLRTSLHDIEDIQTVERPDDKHRYIVICYQGGLRIPSWMASDGTLRLLALTLPAYASGLKGVYLVEEPENGIHPRAVETVFQSLSSVYDAQVLMATHSPVILSVADAGTVLCFAKTDEEATDVVLGSQHPALRDWEGDPNLSVLFAAGVLGA